MPALRAAGGVPVTLVVERPDGVEYRRTTLPDQGIGGRSLDLPIASTASSGTWRVKAFTDPKRPAVGETTFMVEDYVPDRLEFDLAAPAGKISPDAPAESRRSMAASSMARRRPISISKARSWSAPRRSVRAFRAISSATPREEVNTERQPLADLPQTDDDGKAKFDARSSELPTTERLAAGADQCPSRRIRRRAVERKLTLPVTPATDMIGVKPLFSGRSLGERDNANFDVVLVDPEGKRLAKTGLRYELLKDRQPLSMVPAERLLELRGGEIDEPHCRWPDRCHRCAGCASVAAGDLGPLPA